MDLTTVLVELGTGYSLQMDIAALVKFNDYRFLILKLN
jgi:hypothetical protein